MKGSPKDIVALIVVIIIAVSAVGGSIYTYIYLQKNQRSANDILTTAADAVRRDPIKDVDQLTEDLLKARAIYLTESSKLQQMKSLLNSLYTPQALIVGGYNAANTAVTTRADTLFNAPTSAKPQIKVVLGTGIRNEINSKRAALTKTLNDWKALVNSGATGPSAVAQADAYSEQVQDYLSDLSEIVNGLTPGNSGLPQEEINDLIQVIAEATEISQDIPTVPGTSSGSSGSSGGSNDDDDDEDVTPADVEEQEDIVEEIEEEIIEIEEEIENVTNPDTTTNTGGSTGTVNIPPPSTSSTDDSGKPRLVEGANSIN